MGCYTSRVYALATIVGISTLLIWLYLSFARGQFWRVGRRSPPSSATAGSARVVAIIPARNEEAIIALSIGSLLRIPSVHIVVVDDNSTDRTSQVAIETANCIGRADRLTVISGAPLPRGWSGKLWAVNQGVERAQTFQPDFFLFTDADIVHEPNDLERLVALAQDRCYDLASVMVRLRCETFPEKLLIPAFVYFFFKLYPPAFIGDQRRRTAGAAGGCILIRPEALQRAGGIESIRQEIIDDCALARIVKRSGGRIWLGAAERTSSIRHYDSFTEIARMISRTAFNQLRHSSLLLAATIVGLLLTYAAPVGLLFSGHAATVTLGFAALVLMIATYVPMTRYYRCTVLWAFALPLAAIFYMGATVLSALQFWLGRGGQWKGRAQDLVQTP